MRRVVSTVVFLALLAACVGRTSAQVPFTYQGYLETAGTPFTGAADLRFELTYGTLPTSAVFATVNATNVAVTKGVLTSRVDFGQNFFSTTARRFLRVSARAPAGVGTYQLLGYQEVVPVPYAYSAGTALALPGLTVTNGAVNVNGAISKSGPVTSTNNLGLFTLVPGEALRLVTNAGPVHFFTNSALGTAESPTANTAAMTVAGNGSVGMGTQRRARNST